MGDNEGSYQAAFQQFMMGRNSTPGSTTKATTSSSSSVSSSLPSTPTTASLSFASPIKTQLKRHPDKHYSMIIKAFQGILQRDWLEVDDKLGAVMRSIYNLRDRIFWSTSQLQLQSSSMRDHQWIARRPHVHLSNSDIELAVTYELQQHELMMTGARSLLHSLHQAQEALGRRLAEGMEFENELQWDMYGRGEVPPPSKMRPLEQVYQLLAEELYRKQEFVQGVLSSTNDSLFANSDQSSSDAVLMEDNPRMIATKCWDGWRLMSQNSIVCHVLSTYNANTPESPL